MPLSTYPLQASLTLTTSQTIGAGVVKTWGAQQVFAGGALVGPVGSAQNIVLAPSYINGFGDMNILTDGGTIYGLGVWDFTGATLTIGTVQMSPYAELRIGPGGLYDEGTAIRLGSLANLSVGGENETFLYGNEVLISGAGITEIRVSANGIGFFGAAPSAQPGLSNVDPGTITLSALAAEHNTLVQALRNLGLCF